MTGSPPPEKPAHVPPHEGAGRTPGTAGGRRGRRLPWREALLLLGLAAAVAWVARLREERPVGPAPLPVALDPAFGVVARYEFTGAGGTLVAERRGEEFWIVRPIEDRADPMFFAELERHLQKLAPSRTLPDTAGGPFGLDPPRAEARMTNAEGETWALQIGDETPIGAQVYARAGGPGRPILLLDGFGVRRFLQPELNTLRDPVAAALRAGPADSLTVLVPGRELWARREPTAERWIAREPPDLELDAARVNQVVRLLRGPNLSGYPPWGVDPAQLGLASPRAVWVLHQAARHETVRVGRATSNLKGVFVFPSGRAYPAVLSSDHFRLLVDGWPALADRRLLTLPADSVWSVRFLEPASGGYRREAGAWRREADGEAAARPEALGEELRNLAQLQWRAWPETDAAPRSSGRLVIELRSETRAETLRLAAGTDSTAWARSTRRPVWGEIARTAWDTWSHRAANPE